MSRSRGEIELEKAGLILAHLRRKAERSQRLAQTGGCSREQADEDVLAARLQELEVEALETELS